MELHPSASARTGRCVSSLPQPVSSSSCHREPLPKPRALAPSIEISRIYLPRWERRQGHRSLAHHRQNFEPRPVLQYIEWTNRLLPIVRGGLASQDAPPLPGGQERTEGS